MLADQSESRNNIYVIASNWYVNRCPLTTRVPRVPVESTTFIISGDILQYCQTWKQPARNTISPMATGGPRPPFEPYKMTALDRLMDEMEYSSYYGEGTTPASPRFLQKGLRTIIKDNLRTSPVNANTYKSSDFIRDTINRCRACGGDPDVLIVSSNFMTGFAVLGQTVQRIDAGVNVFGVPIDVFEAPFLGGISIIEGPLLRPFSAICLTSSEIRMRMKRGEFWSPGAGNEGDWIAEGAVEVDNQAHHAWVEGITAFSAT